MSPIIFPGQAPESFAGLLKELTARLREMDFGAVAEALGGRLLPDGLLLPSLGRHYHVSRSGILDADRSLRISMTLRPAWLE